jgi:hypothetical protein
VSRSTVFANYAPSLTILIAQGISLCVVFSCAIMLWWVAKVTRDIAKRKLTEGIIRAKDTEGTHVWPNSLKLWSFGSVNSTKAHSARSRINP